MWQAATLARSVACQRDETLRTPVQSESLQLQSIEAQPVQGVKAGTCQRASASLRKEPPVDATSREDAGRGVISLLQEFAQCSKQFRAPARRSILQWKFDEQMTAMAALQFRATVAFVLEGVPHHAVGEWHQSKGIAKRDAAERALELFIGSWGKMLLQRPPEVAHPQHEKSVERKNPGANSKSVAREVMKLEEFCSSVPCPPPKWQPTWEDNKCKVLAEIILMEVPHHFVGAACDDEFTAAADTARRVLWYMNCPGFEKAFEPDPAFLCKADIPNPPHNWLSRNALKDDAVAKQQPKRFA